jgi:hypothetical protein
MTFILAEIKRKGKVKVLVRIQNVRFQQAALCAVNCYLDILYKLWLI